MKQPAYLEASATFSEDGGGDDGQGTYRYRLTRAWDRSLPRVGFLLLNPSTADATKLDATLRRCVGYALTWGFGSICITNLFALRSRHPGLLYAVDDPVGPDNDDHIVQAAKECSLVLAGWGNHGRLRWRGDTVRRLLGNAGLALHYLRLTKAGEAQHPLYLKSDLEPIPWGARAA